MSLRGGLEMQGIKIYYGFSNCFDLSVFSFKDKECEHGKYRIYYLLWGLN